MSVVITGACGGLGKSLAIKFGQNNFDLILLGRNKNELNNFSMIIRNKYKIKVDFYICDAENEDSIKNFISVMTKSKDEIRLLINVAGVFPYGPLLENKQDTFDNCIDVNLRFPYLLSVGLFENLKRNNGGKVINIGSSSAYSGFKNTVLYCASKHALLGFSRALNDEWKEYGVSVHCISSGTLNTDMASDIPQDKSTYIDTKDFADLVYDVSQYNGNMVIEEVLAKRSEVR
jgi:short-subunit dehydrogenase